MDEQFSKITIKVNGKEKDFEEEQKNEASFPWVLPPTTKEKKGTSKVIHIAEYKEYKKEKKRKLPTLKVPKALIGVMVALLIGGGMGVFLLSIIRENPSHVKVSSGLPTVVGSNEEVTIRPLQFYALQGGVFTKKESAIEEKNRYEQKGLNSAVLKQDDKYFVLLGVFANKEDATPLQGSLKEQGAETYGKVFLVDGGKLKGKEGVSVVKSRDFLDKIIVGKSQEKELVSILNEMKGSKDVKGYEKEGLAYIEMAKKQDITGMHGQLLKLVELYSTYRKS